MTRRSFTALWAIALSLSWSAGIGSGQEADPVLQIAGAYFPGRAFPAISNGYLVAFWRAPASAPGRGEVDLHSLADGGDTRVPLAGARLDADAWLDGAAVMPSGTLALAVTQRLDAVSGNRVLELSRMGRVLTQFALGGFEPEKFCAAGDGTLWALGQDWAAEAVGEDYKLLRHYDSTGKLLGAFWSRSRIPVPVLALGSRMRWRGQFTRGGEFLSCGPSSVAAYVGAARTLYEAGPAGLTSRHVVPIPNPFAHFVGLALLKSGGVYASFFVRAPGSPPPPKSVVLEMRPGAGTSARWTALGPSAPPGLSAADLILGSTGDNIFYIPRGGRAKIYAAGNEMPVARAEP